MPRGFVPRPSFSRPSTSTMSAFGLQHQCAPQWVPGPGNIHRDSADLHLGWGQLEFWMGLNLDQGWVSTWTRDGAQPGPLDQGRGSTWTRDGAQPGPLDQGRGSTRTSDGSQPGPWMGPQPEISGRPVSLRGRLKADRNFEKCHFLIFQALLGIYLDPSGPFRALPVLHFGPWGP